MTQPAPRAVALDAANAYQQAFADRLVAAYALGSVAHGGYAAAVSDIDVALILTETRDGDAELLATTQQDLIARGPVYRKLSVFCASLPALRRGEGDGRFPAIDRLDLHDNGELLLGENVAEQVAIPAPGELLLDSARFAVNLLASDDNWNTPKTNCKLAGTSSCPRWTCSTSRTNCIKRAMRSYGAFSTVRSSPGCMSMATASPIKS